MFSSINRSCLTHLLWMSVLIMIGCTPSRILPTSMAFPTQNPALTVTQPPTIFALAQAPALTATLETSPTAQASATLTPGATITNTLTATSTATPTRTFTPELTPTPPYTPTLESDAIVNNEQGVYLRKGPNIAFEPPIALVDDQTALTLLAISPNMLWYKVRTMQGEEGWAYSKLLKIYQEPLSLAVADVPLPTAAVVIFIDPVASMPTPPSAGGGAVPLNGDSVSARTVQIYQQGLQRGNNPRAIAKVGDSITSNQDFLLGYGTGRYNLGAYTLFQDSINYFSPDAFTRQSIAARPGFSAAAVLDPFYAPPDTCQPNETPLMCEYRLIRPSVAIILLGSVDVQRYDANTYSAYLNQVVNITINEGIVPVLTTFPYASNYYPAQSEAFNNVIRSIAASQQIPLIDLQAATLNMPNRGVGSDSFHLTQRSDDWIDLNGEQNQYGTTMRNFITLQMIDNLRRSLGMG